MPHNEPPSGEKPLPSSPPPPSKGGQGRAGDVLTTEQLADRWSISVHTLLKRLRDGIDIKSINLGTPKNPDFRFRLETVTAWERAMERPVSEWFPAETAAIPGGQTGHDMLSPKVYRNGGGLVDPMDNFRPRR